MFARAHPIHLKLFPVKIRPFVQEAQRSRWEGTRDLSGQDVDHGHRILISGVEVRRIVVVVVHEDHNTEEAAYDGHGDGVGGQLTP